MDKLFNNQWFIRLVSVFIALMLFMMVNMDNVNNQPGVLPTLNDGTYTIEDVEITAYYDDEKYAITDMTDSVEVTITGAESAITLFRVTRPSYEVYVDLEGREAGIHHVSVEHRGFPAELGVSIVPQFVRVELEQLQTKAYDVEVNITGRDDIADGYFLGGPKTHPRQVEITATEAIHEQIATVVTSVDVSGADSRINATAPVTIYDEAGNEMNLPINPDTVEVEIPVSSPMATVPVNVTREGTLPDGLSIVSLNVEPREVTIFGPQEVLDSISAIDGLAFDMSEVTESGTYELDVTVPRGVERVVPEKINVTVEVAEEQTAVLENVPIVLENSGEGLEAFIIEPQEQAIDVTIIGASDVIDEITEEDVYLFVDLEGIGVGEHSIPIQYRRLNHSRLDIEEENVLIEVRELAEDES